jgi:uncharacterized protein (DUF362 family)
MDQKLNRRDFLKRSAGTGAAALIVGGGLAWPRNGDGLSHPAVPEFPDVAVVQGQNSLVNTRKVVDLLGGIARFVPNGARVAILPNSQSAHPGTFTKPDIVRAVIRMCKGAGAREINCLSWLPEKFWTATGLAGVLKEEGAALKIVDLKAEALYRPVALPKGKILREAMIMNELFENDCLINLPITKDHAGNKFTGAMKNLMGLNFAAVNRTFHSGDFKTNPDDIDRLDQCIADLNLAVKPVLAIVDATEFITTNGPFGPGEMAAPWKIVAGVDRIAVDSYCASLRGFKGQDILMIKKGYEHGLGEMDLEKVSIQEIAV